MSSAVSSPSPSVAASRPVDPAAPLFIVMNAGSGHDGADGPRAVVERELTAAGREFSLHLVEDGSQLESVARAAVRDASARNGVVVVAGGDGTINCVANACYASGQPLGVLPQGTFNLFSRANGLPLDTAEATRALFGARAYPVQVGLINGRVFLVNASLGLYPQILEDREAYKQQLGRSRWVAILSGLVSVVRHRRQLLLDIALAGEVRTVRTPTLFVGNNALQLERVGVQEAPALEHDRLVGVMLRPVSLARLLWLGVRGAFGTLGEADGVTSFAFERLTVRPHRRPSRLKVATDGEVFELAAPIEFKVAPEPLYVLMSPAKTASNDGA